MLSAVAGIRDNARGGGHRQCRGTLCPRGVRVWGFPVRSIAIRVPSRGRLDAETRHRHEAAARRARIRVGDTRIQERGFNLSSTAPGRGFASDWAASYEGGSKGWLAGRLVSWFQDIGICDGTTCFCRDRRPSASGRTTSHCCSLDDIRGDQVEGTSLIGRGIEAGGHLDWLDATYDRYIAVAVEGFTADVSGNRLNNAPEWAGRLWIAWTGDIGHSQRLSISAESTAQSTVFYTPFTTASRGRVRMTCSVPGSNTARAIADGRSPYTPAISRHGIRHGNLWHAAERDMPDVRDLRVNLLSSSACDGRTVPQ